MDPKARAMIKSKSDPNYQLPRQKSRKSNGHIASQTTQQPLPHSITSTGTARRISLAAVELGPYSKRYRSLSLDHNASTASMATNSTILEDSPNKRVPELINLSSMSKELGLGEEKQKEKKSSISFSAVGFMVESMYRLHSLHATDKQTAAVQAVMEGDVVTLRSLCSQDEAAAAAAAFAAVREDNAELLEQVLEASEAEAKNFEDKRDGEFLLHAAVRAGSISCVSLLVTHGFDPNQWNRSNTATPMHFAAAAGNVPLLEYLADEGGGNVNAGEGSDGHSVLHSAIRKNQPASVAFLLERKANKMGRGKFTETALHAASEVDSHECAKMLLEDGILVDALRGQEARETALHVAAANGYAETVRLLLMHSADPNARNAREETPLHLAAKQLAGPVMRMLVEHGADVNSGDKEGRPPLHFAINSKLKGGTECMQILLGLHADVNAADANGTTALHLAALNRKQSRVKLLIRSGADLCSRNKAGKSALHFVMKYVPNSLKTIEERMDGGLQMENPDNEFDNTVKMNFNLLIPSQGSNGYSSDVSLFTEILAMHNNDPTRLEKILMHPLSLSFLHLKWQQIKWLYYILILFSHLVYSLTYSVYVVLVFSKLCRPEEMDLKNFTLSDRLFMNSSCNFEGNHVKRNFALTAWFFLIFFNIVYVLKETTKLLHLREKYFREWESVLNLMTIISFPLISFHTNPFSTEEDGVTFEGWQYHAAGVGVLITWILQMFLIGKVPRFGKYVQMLMNVGWSFVNFFVAYSSLIAGFSLAFVVLFPREISFEEALAAPIKVMVMMTGEIEYNDLYYPQRRTLNLETGEITEETEPQFFPVTAHAILTIFILIVSIVIMNLLFGMAVSDVQELYKKSRLHQSIQQVHLISYMESILFSPLFFRLPVCAQKFLRRKLHGLEGRYRNVCEIEPDSYDEKKLLPHYLNKTIKDKCRELHQRREEQTSVKTLQSSLQRLERQITLMNDALCKALLGGQQHQQQNPANSTRVSSSAMTTSIDDSLSGDEEDDLAHLILEDEEDGGSIASSSTANRLLTAKQSSSVLGQIREAAVPEEDESDAANA